MVYERFTMNFNRQATTTRRIEGKARFLFTAPLADSRHHILFDRLQARKSQNLQPIESQLFLIEAKEMHVGSSPAPFVQRKRIRIVQIGAAIAAGLVLLSQPAFNNPMAHEIIESIGFGFILACVFGRLWSILYIGGIKNQKLAVTGPYSMTRNPLYFFSTVGAFGIGLAIGSFIYASLLAGLSYLVLRATARKEANFLRAQFPQEYRIYEQETPLFWPKPSLYVEGNGVEFSPGALKRTFFDALFFIALFPIIEFLEYLQETGALPVLFQVW